MNMIMIIIIYDDVTKEAVNVRVDFSDRVVEVMEGKSLSITIMIERKEGRFSEYM